MKMNEKSSSIVPKVHVLALFSLALNERCKFQNEAFRNGEKSVKADAAVRCYDRNHRLQPLFLLCTNITSCDCVFSVPSDITLKWRKMNKKKSSR